MCQPLRPQTLSRPHSPIQPQAWNQASCPRTQQTCTRSLPRHPRKSPESQQSKRRMNLLYFPWLSILDSWSTPRWCSRWQRAEVFEAISLYFWSEKRETACKTSKDPCAAQGYSRSLLERTCNRSVPAACRTLFTAASSTEDSTSRSPSTCSTCVLAHLNTPTRTEGQSEGSSIQDPLSYSVSSPQVLHLQGHLKENCDKNSTASSAYSVRWPPYNPPPSSFSTVYCPSSPAYSPTSPVHSISSSTYLLKVHST